MRRVNLSTILVAFSLSMVAIATLCVGTAGVSLLRRLADDRALARARWASEGGAEALHHTAGALIAAAQLLSERPTLARLVAAGEADSLQSYLDSYVLRGGFSDCAAAVRGQWITTSNPRIPWSRFAPGPPNEWRIARPAPGQPLVLAASAELPRRIGGSVTVVQLLDDAYAVSTGNKVGLPVVIVAAEDVNQEGLDPRGLLHRRALAGDTALATRVGVPPRYVAALPVFDAAGRAVAVLEAALPASEVDASLGRLTRTLLLLTSCIGLVVIGLSLWLARQIARPIEALTQASVRMGHGDFSSPVPVAPGRETATLANAMEEMRERILRLTSELRRKQAEAEAIVTGIVEGVFSVDRERRIVYLNPQAAHLLGVDGREVAGCFCGDVLRPRETGGVRPCEQRCPILHARFRGNASATEHLQLASGALRSVVITSAPPGAAHEGSGGQDLLQFQVIRDESDLEATRRVRDSVLANISHEFRTPLSAQLASLEMLRDKLPQIASTEVRDLVLSVERGTLRLTQLIDNLLESTRIEAGKDDLRRQQVALDQVVEEAIEFVAPLIEQRGQALEVDLPYPLPPITGDGPRLVQVFVNLLANANKFAPPNSAIRIGGSVGETDVRLWIEDQGPGLPAGADDAIFHRFTRSTGAEPEAGGMGLGLYIVKSIVGRHGGEVEARSDETGTRMCVILPREAS